jgi:hypothetical protein
VITRAESQLTTVEVRMSDKDASFGKFDFNMKRVEHPADLCFITRVTRQGHETTRNVYLLRAVIMSPRATLEVFLGSLSAPTWTTRREANALKNVPLRGVARERHSAGSIVLDKLLGFREVTDGEITRETMADYLEQLGACSRDAGAEGPKRNWEIDPDQMSPQDGELSALIDRRYKVAHHAHRNPSTANRTVTEGDGLARQQAAAAGGCGLSRPVLAHRARQPAPQLSGGVRQPRETQDQRRGWDNEEVL